MANTTWSPTDKEAGVTLSGSNLIATAGAGGFGWVRAAHSLTTGRYYWEITVTTFTNVASSVGVATPSAVLSSGLTVSGTTAVTQAGNVTVSGSNAGVAFGSIASGTRICIAFDLTGKLIWYRLDAAGNWNASGAANPVTGVGGVSVPLITTASPAAWLRPAAQTYTANFGDTAFIGAVPAGFTSGFPTVAPVVSSLDTRAMVLA
jgi:hypothetical protein